ncbi:MAG: GNAT family N-acetyltransferase [Anaerolineae bacterium]|nr:GNAT family N-acetyltransferase [Anaerolineae bacterium]
MSSFRIRPAIESDAQGYIDLIRSVLIEQPPVDTPYAPEEFDPPVERIAGRIYDVNESENSCFLIAETDDEGMIGALTCAGGTLAADHHVTSLGMYVRKDWRDQGVGKALMDACMAWAEASPAVLRIELEVYAGNARAIHLYQKYGFDHEGRKRRMIYQNGAYIDNLIMARLLEKAD